MSGRIFSPPYRWLPALAFAFFVACFALHPLSPFYTHRLADPDDYMRLDQVTAWLQGQNWYDLSVPRLSPGAKTIIHWSRLIDLPIAAVAYPFIAYGKMDAGSAVLAASMILPLIWLGVLLAVACKLAKRVTGARNGNLACFVILFLPLLLFQYTPGRIDHHGAQAVIALFGMLSLASIILYQRAALFAALAALAFACGFWIGAEALPWCILFVTCLAFAAAWHDGLVARAAALFGFCLALFTTCLIPVALQPAEFSSRALSWFSPAYAIFAALAGSVLVLGWIMTRSGESKAASCAIYFLLGVIATSIFFILVPTASHGIFTDYDTFDATTALDNINEAQPLIAKFHRLIPGLLIFLRWLFLPLAGLSACIMAFRRSEREVRLVWLAQFVYLLAAIALCVFWQERVGVFMEVFSIAPVVWLLSYGWERMRWNLWDRSLFWAQAGWLLLLGPLPVLLIPAMLLHAPLYPDVILFPATRSEAPCDMTSILPTLLDMKPQTIMNTSDLGPQLLFETKHSVVAGNFDVPGNADAYDFFHAVKDDEAKAAARKWNASLVLFCRTAPTLYLGTHYYDADHIALRPGKDGMLRLTNTDKTQPLIERLIRGENPGWLKPIAVPGQDDYLLFRIQN